MDSAYPYIASLTREAFLFFEMRTTARLMVEGLADNEIVDQICRDNLFQYPTEKSIKQMAGACVRRLKNMGDETLISVIATQSNNIARQVCLYALMKQSRLE